MEEFTLTLYLQDEVSLARLPNNPGNGVHFYNKIYIMTISVFTVSEVVTDWHELMEPLCIMWRSNVHGNEQLDPRCSQQTYQMYAPGK